MIVDITMIQYHGMYVYIYIYIQYTCYTLIGYVCIYIYIYRVVDMITDNSIEYIYTIDMDYGYITICTYIYIYSDMHIYK